MYFWKFIRILFEGDEGAKRRGRGVMRINFWKFIRGGGGEEE
jgi:hypothetical protein